MPDIGRNMDWEFHLTLAVNHAPVAVKIKLGSHAANHGANLPAVPIA